MIRTSVTSLLVFALVSAASVFLTFMAYDCTSNKQATDKRDRVAETDPDCEVREAGIRALESWGCEPASERLAAHHDELPWLDAYAKQVVSDIDKATANVLNSDVALEARHDAGA